MPRDITALMGARGFGHLYHPNYRDKKVLCAGAIARLSDGRWKCSKCGLRRRTEDTRHGEQHHSKIWWLKWGHDGETFFESTGTSDHALAEQYRKNKFKEIWSGRLPWQPTKEPTLHAMLEDAITRAQNRGRTGIRNMVWASRALMGTAPAKPDELLSTRVITEGRIPPRTPASKVTIPVIERYIAAMKAEGWKPASINRTLAQLRRAFAVAYKTVDDRGNRLIQRVPDIELLAEHNVRQVMPTYGEYLAICAQLDKIKRQVPGTLRRLFGFYRITGYRSSEPLKLGWDRVDRVAGLVHLRRYDTKSKKWRAAWPYKRHPELRRIIDEQWRLKGETERARSVIITHVFFRPTGARITTFRKAWVKARTAIGRPDLWVHDFRRVAVRDLVRSGTDRKTAKELIGAKTDSIFERYQIVDEQDAAAAAEKLAKYHSESAAVEDQLVLPFERSG